MRQKKEEGKHSHCDNSSERVSVRVRKWADTPMRTALLLKNKLLSETEGWINGKCKYTDYTVNEYDDEIFNDKIFTP